ncbi:MAG: hypothetical protein IT361_05940 [Gemmatimonadaceae bacterium]|nr:hypothetical protein [Gemmatimonadaceae bacterium]
MQRRTFVRSGASAVALSTLAACARAFRIPLDAMVRPDASIARSLDPDGTWVDALAYARWTPSPHNTQPWRLRVTGPRSAEVFYDPRRLLPTTDPTGAFTIMGLTMFVEYLTIAARVRHLDVDATILEATLDYSAPRPQPFATLALRPATSDPSFDRQLILDRKTSRLPYDGTRVDAPALDALRAIAASHGHRVDASSDDEFVKWAIDLNRFTLFADLDDAPTRTELRRWIRTSDEEATNPGDGLWAHCMRFPGWLMRAFFDDHARWGRGWRARMSGQMLVNGMHGTRTIAWWQGPFATPADWIAAGRVMGRSWLELTRRGVQLHPFGSVITNARAHAQLRARLAADEGANTIWLLARVGRSATAPRSHRIPQADILVTGETL